MVCVLPRLLVLVNDVFWTTLWEQEEIHYSHSD